MDGHGPKPPNINGGNSYTQGNLEMETPEDLEDRGEGSPSHAPLLQVIAELPPATSPDGCKKPRARLSALLDVAQRHLLLSTVLMLALFIPIVALLETRAINLDKQLVWMRRRGRGGDAASLPKEVIPPPSIKTNQDSTDSDLGYKGEAAMATQDQMSPLRPPPPQDSYFSDQTEKVDAADPPPREDAIRLPPNNASKDRGASTVRSGSKPKGPVDVSGLVFVPNGSWVDLDDPLSSVNAGGARALLRKKKGQRREEPGEEERRRYAYMERMPDGTLSSPRLSAGEALRMLDGKWIYLWGDSTMRQLFTVFVTEFFPQKYSFEEAKQLFREQPPQRGRKPFVPLPNDPTPCYLNEHTQDIVLSSEDQSATLRLSYNWKHFIDDEYDEYFFREELPKLLEENGKLPDVLLISTGLHNCFHFGLTSEWENRRDLDRLLLQASAAASAYDLPPIVWVDNVRFVGKEGNPEASERFNGYYRSRIVEELKQAGHRGALVSREELTWTAPEPLWADVAYRIHLADAVQVEIVPYLMRAMKALGIGA